MRLSKKLSVWTGCFLLLASASLLKAFDGPSTFVLDLPFQPNQATPLWLGHPETPKTIFPTLNLPILTPDTNASLLVTVFFQEKEGSFLRISWQGTQGTQLLTNNFYEGIGLANQRSLLISPEMLQGDGTLSFQCGDVNLGIQHVKLEWLVDQKELVSPQIQDLLVTPSLGATQSAQNLDGQPREADPAAWHEKIVNIPFTDVPQRIEQGVEYSVALDEVPAFARISLKEAGLPWGQRLVVWINGTRAGTITPSVPDLADPGFVSGTPKTYVGWRDGAFFVPITLLKAADNTVQFSQEDETPSTSDTTVGATPLLAVKDVVLQLNYPAIGQDIVTPAPTDATPTSVLNSVDSDSDPLPTKSN